MTFVGFSVDRWSGNLIDFGTKQIIEKGILPRELGIALHQNKVNMNENFDTLTRYVFLEKNNNVIYTIFEYHLTKCHLAFKYTSTLTQTLSFMKCKILYVFYYFIIECKEVNTTLQYAFIC